LREPRERLCPASEYRCEYRPGLLSRVRSRGLRSCRDLTCFGDFAEAEELGARARSSRLFSPLDIPSGHSVRFQSKIPARSRDLRWRGKRREWMNALSRFDVAIRRRDSPIAPAIQKRGSPSAKMLFSKHRAAHERKKVRSC